MNFNRQVRAPIENLKLNMLTSLKMLLCEVCTNPCIKSTS